MGRVPRRWSGSIRWYLLGTLVALELLMSFSFLGYFHVEPISVTIAYIPVLLAGALMGPLESAILGTVFGLASMWKASAHYIMAFDQLFSPAMSGQPLKSVLLSVGSRALFGLVVGLLYTAARRAKHPGLWVGIISFAGAQIHSALVYSALWAFFPETGYTPLSALRSLRSLNGILTDLVTAGIVLLVWYLMSSKAWTQFLIRVEAARSFRMGERYHMLSLLGAILLVLISSVAVAIYFVNRMGSVLNQDGIRLSDTEYADLLHLQIQFLIGILAMMALVIIFLIFNRRYATYRDREARTDALTGALSRSAFFQSCGRALKGIGDQSGAYFVMVDIDHFKEINDRYGHPVGDRALRAAASMLESVLAADGFIGRVGGDEFALLLTSMAREELEERLQSALANIQTIKLGEDHRMACSIGAQPITASQTIDGLYRSADHLLYLAKQQGRGRYVIGAVPEEPMEKTG